MKKNQIKKLTGQPTPVNQELKANNPANAVQIIDILTENLNLTRKQDKIFSECLFTLANFVALYSEKSKLKEEK